jgi:hypothetical protein
MITSTQKELEVELLLLKLLIPQELVINIYPYGSKVYGTDNANSDDDYIIVYKSALLPNGAFRNNAVSSKDRKIQAVCYSRGGFQDAINNYEIGALECIFLPTDKVLLKKWPFAISKWNEKEMCKKIISKASASWHVASMQFKDADFEDEVEQAKKGVYHALRILELGEQLRKTKTIYDFEKAKEFKNLIMNDNDFSVVKWTSLRNEMMDKLR